MKLAVSNIAWKNSDFHKFYELISLLNCSGVEVAPSKIWKDIYQINDQDKLHFKSEINKYDLEFLGFHSLLYERNDLQIFKNEESRKKTKDYLFKLVDLCSSLNGKTLIFGSPKNRNKFDNKNTDDIAKNFFYDLSDYAKKSGIFICLEPLDASLTNFLNSINETGNFVNNVGHKNLKLHIDTKSFVLSKESINKNIIKFKNIIKHVHISDKNLEELKDDTEIHREFAKSLKEINYDQYLSLEMKRNDENEISSIKNSINFIKKNYLK